ncbi:ABC transporter substrate-binding protein [Pelagicoccus sp. NFK12]|uniref:ABC transporter substrate-binding protein n=1 Tax=Pelagicoccus enzymogenes TaxID=2773457 RepID=A0A927IGG1_9BACT|nr:extracellular solute-binding protein [Pelagicoccus enzymogenes]MBD5778633.1 ABC transporter substrate-binding protein [Pelagicoccus enzymogenes]
MSLRNRTFSFLCRFMSCATLFLGCLSLRAEQVIPSEDWEDDYNPIASPDALVGGKVRIYAAQYPKSFNYYLDTTAYNATIYGMMFDTLMGIHPVDASFEPLIAESITVSDDKLSFLVKIDDRARWSDGKPITAQDVAFTYETIMKPENLTGPHKVGLQEFEAPEVVDDLTIRFTAKVAHWRNVLTIATLQILPKHFYEGKDFNKSNFEFPVVSGLYRFGTVKEGVSATIERRADWWLKDAKRFQGVGNFQTLEFRFYPEREMAYEAFKKGEFDIHAVYTSHIWVNNTEGEAFDKNWIVKQAITNHEPPSWQGFAMNTRRDLFSDRRVRLALAHLLNRERMNNELMFKQYTLSNSFSSDLWDEEHPNPNPLYEYNKEKARALLAEAGWKANPQTGKLEKDGKQFLIRFLTRSASSDKFLVVYKEDLADLGIDLEIVRKDWAAWMKDMDEFNYDMTWAAWGASLFKDPESMWYSKEADRPAGQNITGFKSEKVDALIEKQRSIYDIAERNDILREIDQLVYQEVPYILLWHIDYTRMLYWNKFGTPYTVLSKFENERSAWNYWWIDPDAKADLEQAMEEGKALAPLPYDISFDEEFDG